MSATLRPRPSGGMIRLPFYGWLLALLPLAACSDIFLDTGRIPAALELGDSLVTLTESESVAISVTVLDEKGEPYGHIPAWGLPVWSSADEDNVEVVGDLLLGRRPSQTEVTVRVADLSATATLRVNPSALGLAVDGLYVTQGSQRYDGRVPLVAGRDGFLRVFLRGDQLSFFLPDVRVELYHGGTLVETVTAPPSSFVPTAIDEGELAGSWNVRIPGDLIRPGLSLAVEADPGGLVPLKPESKTRFPAQGTLSLTVRQSPPLRLRVVPIHQTAFGTTGNVNGSNLDQYLAPLLGMFPLEEYDVELRSPYSTDAQAVDFNGWATILSELWALRTLDQSNRYYYGILRREGGPGGVGYVGFPAALGVDQLPYGGQVLAHELGHNFGRLHAPCGGPGGVDENYPYENASIGVFGFDLDTEALHDPALDKDLMSYCNPVWVSDYTYREIMEFRDTSYWTDPTEAIAEPVLLVWGRITAGGAVLEPAFELEAPARLPAQPGPYRLEGLDQRGAVLFSISFAGAPVDHGSLAARQFAFTIPSRLARADRLDRLRLSGGGVAAVMTSVATPHRTPPERTPAFSLREQGTGVFFRWDQARHRMVIVRDARTREVLSFARGGAGSVRTGARELELLFSDGVRTTERRVTVR